VNAVIDTWPHGDEQKGGGAVDDSIESSVLHLFLEDWLDRFEKEEMNYRSISTLS
jgi:hypothetical protein